MLGGGPAGGHCAGHLTDGRPEGGIVERELLDGECSFPACIRSKTLLRPGEALQAAREAVAVDDGVCTAREIVISAGSEPFGPPVPGLRELPGAWANPESQRA
jgi:dihydrolipoamide dehydrogenase